MKLSKKIWICIFITELLLAGIFYVFQSRKETTELNFTQEELIYESGESGAYLDFSSEHSYIMSPEFTLPPGLYTIEADYERSALSSVSLELFYSDGRYDSVLSGPIALSDANHASCDFRVKYADRPIQLRGRLSGDAWENDYLLIRNIRIIPSPYGTRNTLFQTAAFFLLLDALLLLWSLKDRLFIDAESVKHVKILLLLIALNSIPLAVNYLFAGHDLIFHLSRLEGLKAGLESGMFPVKIQPGWLGGHGYAASLFYGDLLLYPSALLRIAGLSIQTVYRFYILCVNTATVLISYYCFSRMSSKNIGLVCTALYSLNIYRLVCIYDRAAVGEYTAMIFIPLVVFGLWKIYTLPEESKEHGRSWITLAAGCCGIFLSHIITTEMTAFFVLLTCAVLWKKTLRKKTFLTLIRAAAATLCLSLWFFVPLLDYMISGGFFSSGDFVYYRMEDRSAFLAQFFMMDYAIAEGSHNATLGAAGEMPLTLGYASLLVLAYWFVSCAGQKREPGERKEEYLIVFLTLLSLIMTTTLFPYAWTARNLPFLKSVIGTIQYPWRFLTIAGILCAYLLCMILRKIWIDHHAKKILSGLLIGISLFQALSYMSKCLNGFDVYNVYQSGNISGYDVLNGEYLPAGVNRDTIRETLTDRLTYDADSIQVDEWHRENHTVVATLTNNTAEVKQVEVPLLLYKGYHAVTDSGKQLAISPGESFRISVAVPANFTGSIRVAFREPWYWRASELVSLLSLTGLIVLTRHGRRAEKKAGNLRPDSQETADGQRLKS